MDHIRSRPDQDFNRKGCCVNLGGIARKVTPILDSLSRPEILDHLLYSVYGFTSLGRLADVFGLRSLMDVVILDVIQASGAVGAAEHLFFLER